MKVVGIVGSPREGGNTELLTAHVLKAIEEEGIEGELVRLAGKRIDPWEPEMKGSDDLIEVFEKMAEADGIILSTPVYYGSATPQIKALMDRAGGESSRRGHVLSGKVGGALVVARRAGHDFTFAQLLFWFHILGMVVPGSTYWNVAFGREKGDVLRDEEGLRTGWNFGKNMAWLLKNLPGRMPRPA